MWGRSVGPALLFFFSSRRRHTRLQGDWSQTCALPIFRRLPFGTDERSRSVRCANRAFSTCSVPCATSAAHILKCALGGMRPLGACACTATYRRQRIDRKSTRLNSSHLVISYAVFCLKK